MTVRCLLVAFRALALWVSWPWHLISWHWSITSYVCCDYLHTELMMTDKLRTQSRNKFILITTKFILITTALCQDETDRLMDWVQWVQSQRTTIYLNSTLQVNIGLLRRTSAINGNVYQCALVWYIVLALIKVAMVCDISGRAGF